MIQALSKFRRAQTMPSITPEQRNKTGGNILSLKSHRSILSYGSVGSLLSVGSAGSILSIGSAGSILGIFSAGSILSFLAVGSILSVLRYRAVRNQAHQVKGPEIRTAAWDPVSNGI